jgi:hypothetical protein
MNALAKVLAKLKGGSQNILHGREILGPASGVTEVYGPRDNVLGLFSKLAPEHVGLGGERAGGGLADWAKAEPQAAKASGALIAASLLGIGAHAAGVGEDWGKPGALHRVRKALEAMNVPG